MTEHYLVHINAFRPSVGFSIDTEEAQFFFKQLQIIIEQAKTFEGLRWHNHGARSPLGDYLQLPELVGLRTDRMEDNPHIITMAGWTGPKALHEFAYRLGTHIEGMKMLRHWMDHTEGATMAMWWVPRGSRITIEDGWKKLSHLRANGPSREAFTLQDRFDPPA